MGWLDQWVLPYLAMTVYRLKILPIVMCTSNSNCDNDNNIDVIITMVAVTK